MNEPLSSNPLVSELRKAAVGRSDLCVAPIFVREIVKAADEIERLTAENAKFRESLGLRNADDLLALYAERDRLKATAEELRTVSAGLRAALEEIVQHESFDNDGEPMPETGAAFIAKRALAGAAVSLLHCSICKKPMKPAPDDAGYYILDCKCHDVL